MRHPCTRYGRTLTSAELIRWTKGFGAPNIEGHDVAAMFAASLQRLVRPLSSDLLELIRAERSSGAHGSHQRYDRYPHRFQLRRPQHQDCSHLRYRV